MCPFNCQKRVKDTLDTSTIQTVESMGTSGSGRGKAVHSGKVNAVII